MIEANRAQLHRRHLHADADADADANAVRSFPEPGPDIKLISPNINDSDSEK